MSKPSLPSIDDELAPSPRPRVNLKGLKPRETVDDAAVDANSRRLGEQWGASTSLPTEAEPGRGTARVSLASLRLEIPAYLDDELTVKAARARVTKAFLVLTALEKAGYWLEPGDLVPDRRKTRHGRV